MRARMLIFVVAILAVAGFVALNWSEFLRTTPLSFGAGIAEAPLGLIMLGLLFVGAVAFILSGAMHRTQTLVESRQHLKELQHHRDLADRAEASRFTELREHMDTQLRELRQRDTIAASEFEKALLQSQRDLKGQVDLINRTLASRLAEIEQRLDARMDRMHGGTPVAASAVRPVPADSVLEDPAPVEEATPKRRFWPL
jgi:uncharacterized integral membrane protein